MTDAARPRWAIVLAGGDGVRLRPYVERRFGESRPKQYCAFSGRRTMLQHTLARAAALAGAARTVTVVSAAHEAWAMPQLGGYGGRVVAQTHNRDTGPGVYLPLAHVRARAPDAIVYILPSDHYVRPIARFVAAVRAAGDIAAANPERIILTGVTPHAPDPEYGYIEPGEAVDRFGLVRRVARFVEKPSIADAAIALARGAVWNTMIIAATVDALWSAACITIPEVMHLFGNLALSIDTPSEGAALDAAYLAMPSANFSRDVLEPAADRCLVTRLDGVEWSDWGRAERIEATIARRHTHAELHAVQ
jgi:mannose-1-phosphate guanylyltransferase